VAINEKIEPLGVVVRCIGPARYLEDADGVDPSGPSGVKCRSSGQPDIAVALWGLVTRTEPFPIRRDAQSSSGDPFHVRRKGAGAGSDRVCSGHRKCDSASGPPVCHLLHLSVRLFASGVPETPVVGRCWLWRVRC
jgi:hypothetical protein